MPKASKITDLKIVLKCTDCQKEIELNLREFTLDHLYEELTVQGDNFDPTKLFDVIVEKTYE